MMLSTLLLAASLFHNVAAVTNAAVEIDAAIAEKGGTPAGGLTNAPAAILALPSDAGAKIEYSDAFLWSVSPVNLATNGDVNVYRVELFADALTNIEENAYFAGDIRYYWTRDLGTTPPQFRYATGYNGDLWTPIKQDAPQGPFADEWEGLVIANAYKVRSWIPCAFSNDFFRVFGESSAAGAYGTLPLVGGVNGGFTGEIVVPPTGKTLTIKVVGGVTTSLTLED